MADHPEAQDLNTPERTEFYRKMEARQKMQRLTFSVTVDVDVNMVHADLEATISDGLRIACLHPVRVKRLPVTGG